ncbi:DUF397 domain-containing protein [Streptomyces sp. CRN 30]|uniref:DUF397 domain-containing protein n=1 Tax=Streptomyces sp. CRN 30 TaxID=3075613 RepID=UPI002A7F41FB|nr:DUF397 domain-containing protein [Streptomyces sp. CRN 30]
MPDFRFHKSSYSDPERECVEIATNNPPTVAIRDSKNPTGPVLRLRSTAWAAFGLALRENRV